MIKTLVVNTDGQMTVEEVEDFGLAYLQSKVGGYIEAIGAPNRWSAYLNEEGKLPDPKTGEILPINTHAHMLAVHLGWRFQPGDVLVGNVVFVGPPDDEGNDTPVPDFVLAESVLVRATFATFGEDSP
jgi:hypothetical protein